MVGLGPVDEKTTIEQRSIDDQVSQLEARIRSLKTKRNTYARVSQLPVEIISEIFIMAKWSSISLRNRYKVIGGSVTDFSGEKNWLNVAGVCTHWRQLALQCPRLWSAINLSSVDRALGMLKRSKSAPLEIFCPNVPDTDEVAQLVMSNIHRIRTFDIGVDDDEQLFKFLQLNEGASAPMLHTITLRSPMYSLPGDILERDMPSLQELNLIHGTLKSPLPPFPHLKKLLIRPSELDELSVGVLLQTLQNTPNLEELRARQVISHDHSMDQPEMPSLVHLPRLTCLDISAVTVSSSKVFEFIKYPKTTSVTFECEYLPPSSDYSHLINALTHFISLPGRVIHEVTVSTLIDFRINLDAAHQSSTHGFELTLNGDVEEFLSEATTILAAIPLSKANSLHLDRIALGTIEPPLFFARCSEVKDLTLTACPVQVFCGLKKVKGSKLPLPKLRRVHVEQSTFNRPSDNRNLAMCDAVRTVLKQRKRLNVGIKELTLAECDIAASVVEEFKEYTHVHLVPSETDDENEEDDYSDEEGWSSDIPGSYLW
ncbi:hypothetical protein ONZ45_g9775 [Pleurotus djamor]|nr:hypothetical protein ONZ45_g9775 [Pleurotus djamor]